MNKTKAPLGIWMATALVVGSMIGSGVFLAPSALSLQGPISILGWVLAGGGALALSFVFSELSKTMKATSGGPYAFSRKGLGEFAGFLVAWGYWISIWCTNAAIIIALVGYLGYFFPVLNSNPVAAVVAGQSILWGITYLNTRGVRDAGVFQLVTSALKITPLILVGFVGLFYIDMSYYTPMNLSGGSDFSAVSTAATFALFSFLGVECATIPAGDVQNPERTIPRATYIGLGITFLVYILGTISIMGIIPAEELMTSPFPYAEAAEKMWGSLGGKLVAIGAVISTLGALNGWILIQGQIPAAAAADKLFPEVFGRKSKRGVPAIGLVISSVFVAAIMLMNFTEGLIETFSYLILLSTFLALVPYAFSSAAFGIALMQGSDRKGFFKKIFIALIAFLFTIWAFIGSGEESVFAGFIILLFGIPMFVFMKSKKSQ